MKCPTITIFCPTLGTFGGTETHVTELSLALASKGWKVRLTALRSSLDQPTKERLKTGGVLFSSYPSPSFFLSLASTADIFYTNSQGNASAHLWRFKGSRQKGFHHVHTSASESEQHYWPDKYRSFILKQPRIVACSRATKTELRKIGAQGTIDYIPCINAAIESINLTSVASSEMDRPVRFGFIGRVEKPKGVDLIISAAQSDECKGIEWHFYGDGDYMIPLREMNLPSVVLHGRFNSGTELKKIHSEIDAVVLPSFHSEGMPLCLVEAMASGLPWIATNKGGTTELAGSLDDCIVIEAGETEVFTKKCALMRDRILQDQINVAEIKRRFQEGFSRVATSAQWVNFLSILLTSDISLKQKTA